MLSFLSHFLPLFFISSLVFVLRSTFSSRTIHLFRLSRDQKHFLSLSLLIFAEFLPRAVHLFLLPRLSSLLMLLLFLSLRPRCFRLDNFPFLLVISFVVKVSSSLVFTFLCSDGGPGLTVPSKKALHSLNVTPALIPFSLHPLPYILPFISLPRFHIFYFAFSSLCSLFCFTSYLSSSLHDCPCYCCCC